MSLAKLSPTAIKIGIAVPFVLIGAGLLIAFGKIPPPPGQGIDLAITTTGVVWAGVLVVQKLSRGSRILWSVLSGFLGLHLLMWGLLWPRTAHLAGVYLYGATVAEIYGLGWLLTWVAAKKHLKKPHHHRHGA